MRRVTLEVEGLRFQTVLDDAVRLSVPLDFHGDQARAFGLPPAEAEPIEFDGAACDTAEQGPFNAESLSLIPHGNGTHTETVGHLVDHDVPVGEQVSESLIPCTILTVDPLVLGKTDERYPRAEPSEDRVLTRHRIEASVSDLELPDGFLRAVILRTAPNEPADRFRDYSETNPPYPTSESVEWLVDRDVEHLLVDLPSVDREREGGVLSNHRIFWGLGAETREQHPPSDKTITEFVHVPESVPDGVYFLNIQVPDFRTNAAPSRPLLYEAIPVE